MFPDSLARARSRLGSSCRPRPPATSALVAPLRSPVPTAAVSAHVVACDRGACPHKAHLRDDSSAAERCAPRHTRALLFQLVYMRRLSGSAEDCRGREGKRTSDHRDAFERPRPHASAARGGSAESEIANSTLRVASRGGSKNILSKHVS